MAVDLLNWTIQHKISEFGTTLYLKNFIYRWFSFVDLLNWSILGKISECGVCHFPVDLLNWEKIFFTNSKISYIDVFSAVDLLNWTFLPNISECVGMSFCCWLVESGKKIYFTNSKISYIGVFPSLTCWIGPSWLKFPNVGLCHFAVDLLNWENHFHATQKKLI